MKVRNPNTEKPSSLSEEGLKRQKQTYTIGGLIVLLGLGVFLYKSVKK